VYNPAVPERVAHVLARALARDRDDRFSDAREFLDSLRVAGGGMASRRGGLTSNDDSIPSSSDPGPTPVSAGRTPSTPSAGRKSRAADPARAATIKFRSTPPPDEPRPSALVRRKRAEDRQRRMFVLVAVSALVVGSLVAVLLAPMLRPPERRPRPAE